MSRNFDLSVDEYYHFYNRGNDKRLIFLCEGDYLRFILLLYTCNNKNPIHLSDYKSNTRPQLFYLIKQDFPLVSIGAWCLMPNHFHLLIKEVEEGGASLFMQKISTAYTMYFNIKYGKKGSLFSGRFKAKHLDYDEYLKYQYAYIHLNPVSIIDKGWKKKQIDDKNKAREFLDKYAYSSYLDYCGIDRPESKILCKKSFPEHFEFTVDFQAMIDEWLNFDELEDTNVKVEP
jgi:putative transposase